VKPQDLDERGLRHVERANWYEAFDEVSGHRVILVPFAQAGQITETDPLDCGIDVNSEYVTITRIGHSLKRWSEEDGFYHS
jgi:hypothetical protein